MYFICYRSYTQDLLQVSELESQMDSFEAEIERLTVKKSRNLPPRLVKLFEQFKILKLIYRHKWGLRV